MPSGEAVRGRLGRIAHLVVLNAFVGGMVGLERANLPLLAEREFGIASATGALAFIVTFGIAKAFVNLAAGALADRHGRRRILVAGWLFGIPVPVLILVAPDWSWVLVANVFLGINQGLAWSMTVNMKLDLVGARRRGLVVSLNEVAGYGGMALVALVAGLLAARDGLRPAPYHLGIGIALVGLALALGVRETAAPRLAGEPRGFLAAFRQGTWADARLSAASFAGFATNFKDGALWGLLPILLFSGGIPAAGAAVVVAAYPAAWGFAQLASGPISDRVGRRALVVPGMFAQAVGVAWLVWASDFGSYLAAALVVGLGTAMVYPTLLAHVSDGVDPRSRASALGVYRFWRDAGYAAGALGAGLAADAAGLSWAFGVAAVVLSLAGAGVLAARAHPLATQAEPAPDDG